jgi:hypothetical protein
VRRAKKQVRVRIRGKWWSLEIKRLAPVKRDGRWTALHGLCDFSKRTITLNPQFDMKSTLLHEVTHACQPDLDESTVEEIEDAHVNAVAGLHKILELGFN